MGDFNIDMKVKGYIPGKLMKTINSAGLNQLVSEAIRITSASETIIDLVFANVDFDVEVRYGAKNMDHSVVALIWNIFSFFLLHPKNYYNLALQVTFSNTFENF